MHDNAQKTIGEFGARGSVWSPSVFVEVRNRLVTEIDNYAGHFTDQLQLIFNSLEEDVVLREEKEIFDLFCVDLDKLLAIATKTHEKYRNLYEDSELDNVTVSETLGNVIQRRKTELDLQFRKIQKQKKMTSNITYNFGDNTSKININSTDYSINIKNSKVIFDQLKEVITDEISDQNLSSQLGSKVEEMKSTLGTDKYRNSYKDFVSLAANHMAVFSKLLPALTSLLN